MAAANLLLTAGPLAILAPQLLPFLGGAVALSILSDAIGGPGRPSAYISPSEQRKWYLQRVYGNDVGNFLFQKEWSDQQIEVDVRGKLP